MADRSLSAVDVLVGQRLRMARMTKGVSQEKLADAVGLTFQQIQKYEKGKNRIGSGRLHAMAQVLGVPPSYFFEGAKSSMATAASDIDAVRQALSTKEGVRIAVSLSRISDLNLRRSIADLLEEIIASETKEPKVAGRR